MFNLKDLPISRKLALIVIIFSIIICTLFSFSFIGMEILSAVRATINGQGLWAKDIKDANFYLSKYIITHDEKDFQTYKKKLQIHYDLKEARDELRKEHPDFKYSDKFLIKAYSHPRDVRLVGYLFRYLRFAYHVKTPLKAWVSTDYYINKVEAIGENIHKEISSGNVSEKRIKELLAEIDKANLENSMLGYKFCVLLGDAARWTKETLVKLMILITVLSLFGGLFIAYLISKHICDEIEILQKGAERIAKGDFSQKLKIESKDEIGNLAKNFQEMADKRQNAEESMEREITRRQEVEKILEQRAIELDNVNKELILVEKLKSEFFANVSHELRTPLTLALAPVETLLADKNKTLDSNQRLLLQTVHNNAIRLLQMVTGLLDFSKLEAGKVRVFREPIDIVTLTKSIIQDFIPLTEQKKLEIKFNSNLEKAVIEMDRYIFDRILFNLLSNAIKFTNSGGKIFVNLEILDNKLKLDVSDTGIGISEADVKHLFQKFRQVEGSVTRRFEGTGLGLSLVKEFSALLEGDVSVKSKLGEGSIFTVECLAPKSNIDKTMTSSLEPKRSLVQSYQSNKALDSMPEGMQEISKILVAEDNVELSSYICSLLKDFCQIRVAEDGVEALKILKEYTPDVVLSDVMMPNLDGLSLCKEIKSNPQTASIPVILLTALTHREALLKGWEAGADEYLFKPFHPTELITRVKSIITAVKERKLSDKEIKSLNKELEKKISELKISNKELESFSYSISHDLRAPLRAISGFSSILLADYYDQLSDDAKRLLNQIINNSEKMANLIDDLLNFSRLGRKKVTKAEINMDELVKSVISELKPNIDFKNTEITIHILPVVNVDISLMKQVWVNLISNAIKYSSTVSKPIIEIGSSSTPEETIFYVKDNGVGFDMQYAGKLFGVFQRLHTDEQFTGTGVGLAIVQSIIQKHGGRVWAEAEVNKGATFFFSLPK